MKNKRWPLLLLLILAALLLSGCGIDYQGVDVRVDPPEGVWRTFAVWPLARGLLWFSDWLKDVNAPFHWGFSIILMTILLKAVTFPLTLIQTRSMQAQKDLQPKLQELQKKHGDNREKMAAEQMKLYREAGVNPLGGCLPLVVQMPILFGFYHAILALDDYLVGAPFFWIPDLGFPTYSGRLGWITEFFNQGQYADLATYLVLPVLLMVSQFAMQKWMTPQTPDTGSGPAGMTKQITLMMTLMFGLFTLQVPSGLTLYWVTSNLLQVAQQFVIMGEKLNFGSPTKMVSAAIGINGTTGNEPDEITALPNKPATAGPSQSNNGRNKANRAKKGARRSKKRKSKRR